MKRMIVTGGAGFIGTNFIRYMMAKYPDLQIANFDALTYAGNKKNILPNDKQHIFDVVDLVSDLSTQERREQLGSILAQVDYVVHFAAETHVDNSIVNPYKFLASNVVGTVNLLESIRLGGRNCGRMPLLLHVSTDEVYGSLPLTDDDKGPWIESDPYEPNSPYAASKASSEHFVRAYGTTYNVPYIITNCGNNYGPYQHLEKFIPKVITNAYQSKKIPIYGGGFNVRDWIYVTDHCAAIDILLQRGIVGEKYNIGPGHNPDIDNTTMVKLIIALMGLEDNLIEYVTDRPGHDLKYALDSTKLIDLGWKQEVELEDGLQRTIKWYKENQDWWKV